MPSYFFGWLVVMALWMPKFSGAAPDVLELSFRSDITLKSPTVRFQDLIYCRGFKSSCANVLKMTLRTLAHPYRNFRVLKSDILLPLRSKSNSYRFDWDGPVGAVAVVKPEILDHASFVNELSRQLSGLIPSTEQRRFRLSSLTGYREVRFMGTLDIVFPNKEIALSPDSSRSVIPMIVRFKDQQSESQQRVFAKILLEALQPVASRNLQKSHKLTDDDMEYRWTKPSSVITYSSKNEIIGKKLSRSKNIYSGFSHLDFQDSWKLRRGVQVTAILQVGGMKIERQAKAFSSGEIGKNITIGFSGSARKIQAKVIDSTTVEVL